jgi:surfeit locus 1 family protein
MSAGPLAAGKPAGLRRYRPALWPSVAAIPAFLILLGLGSWQLQRLHWKEGLIAAREAAIAAPPIPVPRTVAAAEGMDLRHVSARGSFLNDKEFYLGATDEAGTTGYHVVTPLRLADGALLLVDRGWIPSDRKDRAGRAAGLPRGEVEIEGLLRLPRNGRPNWFVPDNDCARNYWFWIDVPAMAACAGLERVLPVTMDAGPAANSGGFPRGGATRIELPNDHLQYAITWFALAGALAVIYLLYVRGRLREAEGQEAAR